MGGFGFPADAPRADRKNNDAEKRAEQTSRVRKPASVADKRATNSRSEAGVIRRGFRRRARPRSKAKKRVPFFINRLPTVCVKYIYLMSR